MGSNMIPRFSRFSNPLNQSIIYSRDSRQQAQLVKDAIIRGDVNYLRNAWKCGYPFDNPFPDDTRDGILSGTDARTKGVSDPYPQLVQAVNSKSYPHICVDTAIRTNQLDVLKFLVDEIGIALIPTDMDACYYYGDVETFKYLISKGLDTTWIETIPRPSKESLFYPRGDTAEFVAYLVSNHLMTIGAYFLKEAVNSRNFYMVVYYHENIFDVTKQTYDDPSIVLDFGNLVLPDLLAMSINYFPNTIYTYLLAPTPQNQL